MPRKNPLTPAQKVVRRAQVAAASQRLRKRRRDEKETLLEENEGLKLELVFLGMQLQELESEAEKAAVFSKDAEPKSSIVAGSEQRIRLALEDHAAFVENLVHLCERSDSGSIVSEANNEATSRLIRQISDGSHDEALRGIQLTQRAPHAPEHLERVASRRFDIPGRAGASFSVFAGNDGFRIYRTDVAFTNLTEPPEVVARKRRDAAAKVWENADLLADAFGYDASEKKLVYAPFWSFTGDGRRIWASELCEAASVSGKGLLQPVRAITGTLVSSVYEVPNMPLATIWSRGLELFTQGTTTTSTGTPTEEKEVEDFPSGCVNVFMATRTVTRTIASPDRNYPRQPMGGGVPGPGTVTEAYASYVDRDGTTVRTLYCGAVSKNFIAPLSRFGQVSDVLHMEGGSTTNGVAKFVLQYAKSLDRAYATM